LVNDPQEVLAAFQAYYETAEPAGVTDPHLIFELKAIDAFEAHSVMSKRALDSERVRDCLRHILPEPAELYGALRGRGGSERRVGA
jgi:hypothetical protein